MFRMPDRTFTKKTPINTTTDELFAWHTRQGAFDRLVPPWERVEVIQCEGIHNGARTVAEVWGWTKRRWVAEHRDYIAGMQFRDVQLQGPFAKWEHTHRVEPDPAAAGRTAVMHDHVAYQMPFWLLGAAAHGLSIRDRIEQAFAYRHATLARDIEDHKLANGKSLTVAITGKSGMVGSALAPFLTTGGHAVRAVARPDTGVGWNANALSGSDAVVHLAGEPIAQRWTPAVKQRIEESRVAGTRVLCEALARMSRKPSVLVAASAVGYYGNRGDEVLTEQSDPGDDFLAAVGAAWEEATRPAVEAGIRVVNPRIGLVLSPRGGALEKMLPAFRKGLGGKLAGGGHWWSWIGIDDLVGVIYRAMLDPSFTGPVNAVAPGPVTNAQFTKVLGRVLGRPTVMPVPKLALRLAFGEMGPTALLSSNRVDPAKLKKAGYHYRHDDLEQCLRAVLGRRRDLRG